MRDGAVHFRLELPLASGPVKGQMRAAQIGGFHALVRNLGGDPRWILEKHGIDPIAIGDPDYYLDCVAFINALEYCSSFFDDSLFGLRLADLQSPDVFGCVTALARSAPLFRDGLQCCIDYFPVVHSPEGELEMATNGGTAELRCALPDFGSGGQAIYQALLLDLKIFQMLGGRDFRPNYVNVAHDVRRKDIPTLEDRIGCHVHRKATSNETGNPTAYAIGFPASFLDRPIASANRLTFNLLGAYLRRMKAGAPTTIVERIEAFIRGALPYGNCTIARCATKLGTSVRTLQSRLAEHGLKFSDVLEKQRVELATDYLRDAQYNLGEIAALLGYSEHASFGRAFKRWTGLTPQAFRYSARNPS